MEENLRRSGPPPRPPPRPLWTCVGEPSSHSSDRVRRTSEGHDARETHREERSATYRKIHVRDSRSDRSFVENVALRGVFQEDPYERFVEMFGGTTMRRTLFAGVLLCFLSGALGGVLPTVRLTTSFELDSCQAFAGTQKQATVRAFCQTIITRASFPSDTECDVPASGCIEPARRALLQTFSSTANIVQQGSFGGLNSTEVVREASAAVNNTAEFQDEVVLLLELSGEEEIASQLRNTTIEGTSTDSEDDPPPIPNECESDVDCDLYYSTTPVCLTTATPFICVQCREDSDCDAGEYCAGFNECQAL